MTPPDPKKPRIENEAAAGVLGSGSYGRVIQDPVDPKVAIKIMPLFDDDGCVEDSSVRELLISSMIRSPGTPMYIRASVSKAALAEVSVYMSRATMDLSRWCVNTPRAQRLELVDDFARQLVDSLASLHSSGFVHGDLKPGNVLLFVSEARIELKIADLGSCSMRRGQMCPERCTYAYRPPEGFFKFPPSRYYDYR